MKIAYSAFLPGVSAESGVFKKMLDQVGAWRALGHEAKLFILTSKGAELGQHSTRDIDVLPGLRAATLFALGRRHVKRIGDWQPDVVYHRHAFYVPGFCRLARGVPIVVEINSDDRAERRLLVRRRFSGLLKLAYHAATRRRFLSRVAGAVFVTRELARRNASWAGRSIVSGNGIALDRIAPVTAPTNASPRFFFLGSPSALWTGFDKVLDLAARRSDWRFDLVGIGPADVPSLPPGNCTLHGRLAPDAYRPILARCDVAIGSLATHRIGMREACPLKVREYLASGLPTVIGYDDTDFPAGAPFLLNLPNEPINLVDHIDRIESFANAWCGKRVPRGDVAHLDVLAKEKDRLEFLAHVVQGRIAREGTPHAGAHRHHASRPPALLSPRDREAA